MLNLLKYELKKRKSILIVGTIILLAAEGLSLYLVNKGVEYAHLAAVLMGLMFFGVILVVFLDVATQYYSDFKKSQGTLLFLTPNNGYKIVGSKMIFGALELLVGLGIVVLLSWITNSAAVNLGYTGISPMLQSFSKLIASQFGEHNTTLVIAGFVFLVFLQYTTSQSIAVSSITLGRTIMSRNSYNWLWAVLLFIGVNVIIQTINGGILGFVGMQDGLFSMTFNGSSAAGEFSGEMNQNLTEGIYKYLIIGGVQYIFWIVVSFFGSSLLLNKKIDV